MKLLIALAVSLIGGLAFAATAPAAAVPDPPAIIIYIDTDPESETVFEFEGDLGDFDVADGDPEEFGGLDLGEYEIQMEVPDAYELTDVDCDNAIYSVDLAAGELTVEVQEDETVTCLFSLMALPTQTPTPTNTPVPTATATPVPPTQTPVVIVRPVEVTRVVTVERVIRPPSTGDGGIR